jgi:hypothetical protein
MKQKRKAKRGQYTLDFVTSLSVEECVRQLEQAAFRSVDERLSARSDGQRFVVEFWKPETEGGTDSQVLNVRVEGWFDTIAAETHIQGEVTANRYREDAIVAGAVLIFCTSAMLGLLLFGFSSVAKPDPSTFTVTAILGGGILFSLSAAIYRLVAQQFQQQADEKLQANLSRIRGWLERQDETEGGVQTETVRSEPDRDCYTNGMYDATLNAVKMDGAAGNGCTGQNRPDCRGI